MMCVYNMHVLYTVHTVCMYNVYLITDSSTTEQGGMCFWFLCYQSAQTETSKADNTRANTLFLSLSLSLSLSLPVSLSLSFSLLPVNGRAKTRVYVPCLFACVCVCVCVCVHLSV